jgi:membrane protein required for colicin V production
MNLSFGLLDFFIVVVILASVGYAVWRGFLWETLTIFAWVAAAFGCLYFGPYIIPLMRGVVAAPWLASLLAYAAVFLAIFIPLAFMSHRFSESVKHSPIGPLDRAMGVAFGVVRGLVLVGLAYLAFTYFVPIRQHPRWLTQAALLPMVQNTAEVMLTLIPDHGHDLAAYVPDRPEVIRQAPPENTSHDPMAELIRKNETANRVSPATATPVRQQSAAKAAKPAGTKDRQGLDNLIQTGGKSAQ